MKSNVRLRLLLLLLTLAIVVSGCASSASPRTTIKYGAVTTQSQLPGLGISGCFAFEATDQQGAATKLNFIQMLWSRHGGYTHEAKATHVRIAETPSSTSFDILDAHDIVLTTCTLLCGADYERTSEHLKFGEIIENGDEWGSRRIREEFELAIDDRQRLVVREIRMVQQHGLASLRGSKTTTRVYIFEACGLGR